MDIKTLILALALGNVTLCAALFFHDYHTRKALTLSTWAMAKQFQAVAWLLLYFRGVVPEMLAGPAANALLLAGLALDAGALWEADGRTRWRRILFPALGAGLAVYLASYATDPESGLRAAAGSAIAGAFVLAGVAALARRWHEASMLRRFLAVTMAVLALLIANRGLTPLLLPDGWYWVSPNLMQALGYGAFYLLMLANGLGFLLLAREKLQGELARQEVVDPLTDVPNRRGFYTALAPWMSLARRPGQPTAMILLELDQFKPINDHYGHPVGETVLKAMVDACNKQLRDSDLMGRLGGAEFAILLPRTSVPDALVVAERVRAAVEQRSVKAASALIKLTISLGVTAIRPDDSNVSLFKRADEALQAAKLRGHNQVAEAAPVPEPDEELSLS
jgi:diguanylate cyclase (GGDEF)-like protein